MSAVRWSLPAAGLLLLGCPPAAPSSTPGDGPAHAHSPSAVASPTKDAADADPRYVMLWEGAMLASGFDATADTARAFDSRPEAPVSMHVWIMRRVAAHGEWLEVETVETNDESVHHCAWAFDGLDGYALRLYVRAEDAVPVTSREVAVTVAGGNRVTLSPGVRVTLPPRVGDPALVHVNPPLPLAIPADAIGHDYRTPHRYDLGEPIGSVGPDALQLTEDILLPEYLGWRVLARRDEGPVAVITVADPCVRYELHVPTMAIEDPVGIGQGGGGSSSLARHAIAAQAPIYWSNGERAGVTRHAVERPDEPLRREVGRVCFAHSITWGSKSADPVLVLCFDEPDVRMLGPVAPAQPAATPAARAEAASSSTP